MNAEDTAATPTEAEATLPAWVWVTQSGCVWEIGSCGEAFWIQWERRNKEQEDSVLWGLFTLLVLQCVAMQWAEAHYKPTSSVVSWVAYIDEGMAAKRTQNRRWVFCLCASGLRVKCTFCPDSLLGIPREIGDLRYFTHPSKTQKWCQSNNTQKKRC